MALVIGGAALIRDRTAALSRDLPGPQQALLRSRPATQELFGLGGDEVPGAEGREANARVRNYVPVEPDRRASSSDRPVSGAPRHLLIRVAAAGPDRQPDLGQQLGRANYGLVGASVELAR